MTRPVDVLLEYLRGQERRGVSHVHLDDDARQALRALYQTARGKPAGAAAPRSSAPAAGSHSTPSAPAAPTASAPAAPTASAPPAQLPQTHGTPAEQLAALAATTANWPPLRGLGTLRETMVFSAGDPTARLMLVGEAPGHHDEGRGEPFCGPAGDKLTAILKTMGLERSQVYLTNIVKFRPALPNQTINNRKPSAAELAACLPILREEIRIVAPEVIVAFGATAAEALLGAGATLDALSGSWHALESVPLRVTFHPAELLHGDEALPIKRRLWEDMLAVMERLGMPISTKQRGFFQNR